jgi:hypothetical protein
MLRASERHHAALLSDPAVAAVRFYMIAALDPLAGGTPNPLQWALLVGWTDREARDERLYEGSALRPFVAGADESLSIALDTVRVRPGDSLGGWRPSADDPSSAEPGAPVVVMTHSRLVPRHLWDFTWRNARVVRAIRRNPEQVMSVGALDHPLTRATFSIWRSRKAMTDFTYRAEPHNGTRNQSVEGVWGDPEHDFFARFRPTAWTGTWGGRDPLAEAWAR